MKIVQHISHSPFQENTYILYKNDNVLVIDPGDAPQYYEAYLQECKIQAVLATHGHLDHIMSAKELCSKYSCPFIVSREDGEIIDRHELTCKRYNQPHWGTPGIDVDISKKESIQIEDFDIKIFHTPGHTPGSVCFLIDDVLFSGDTLFHRSVGRTDLPGGDHGTLMRSLSDMMKKLPDNTVVYPGHMGQTTIGDEKLYNPFIKLN